MKIFSKCKINLDLSLRFSLVVIERSFDPTESSNKCYIQLHDHQGVIKLNFLLIYVAKNNRKFTETNLKKCGVPQAELAKYSRRGSDIRIVIKSNYNMIL